MKILINTIIKTAKYVSKYVLSYAEIILYKHSSQIKNHPNDMEIKRVNDENITDALYFQSDKYIKQFKKFLIIGDKGYYAYINGKCIHRTWVSSGCQMVYPHWAYPMPLTSKQNFIRFCETASEARGQGIYPKVLSFVVADIDESEEILISVDAKNKASIKGVEKAGFSEDMTIYVLVIFGFKFNKIVKVKTL